MFENLRELYRHYGGIKPVLKSGYFWVSVVLTILSGSSVPDYGWADKSMGVMPSLTGFTIASFAIIFAILSPEMLRKLMGSDDNGRSPISRIAASIGHAVSIQISAILIAILSGLVDTTAFVKLVEKEVLLQNSLSELILTCISWGALFFSALGLFLMYYGIMLVLAAILSIFRMQLIVSGITKTK